MENSYKNIFKAISLFGSVQGLNILLNLVRTKIAASLLGPEGFGLVSIYNETRELVHTSTNLGMDTAGIRGISKAYEDWHNAIASKDPVIAAQRDVLREKMDLQVVLFRSWVLLLAALGTFACMVLAHPLSYFTFQDFAHAWGYALLSPAVGLATLTCGEMVVLKALRKLKAVAIISLIDVIITILISTPIYYMWGVKGVLPTLVIMGFVQMAVVAFYSYRLYPPKFIFNKPFLGKGVPMIMLGISFALSGVVAHVAQLGINAYINAVDGEAAVGLFRSAYSIAMIYAGSIVFASLDSDYFPRLAGVFGNIDDRRITIWRQVRLTFLLIIPVVLVLEVALPWLIPLLFSDAFTPMILPARIACLSLIFRSVYLPLAYAPLAAGDSKTFLLLECISYAILAGGVILGYTLYGMEGAGAGLILSNATDMVITYLVAKIKYQI